MQTVVFGPKQNAPWQVMLHVSVVLSGLLYMPDYTLFSDSVRNRKGPAPIMCSTPYTGYILSINLYHSLGQFSRQQIDDIFLIFPENRFNMSIKLSPKETVCMKC